MGLDKKLIQEITRYHNINKYIMEQDAEVPEDPTAGLEALTPPPPAPGGEVPPAPAASEAVPPPAPGEGAPQPIDVANDPDVEKIDDEGQSEETSTEGEESEELEITDLVNSQKNIETKQEEYFENLFNQLSNLEAKLGEMDNVMNKLNSLESKIEKYREKTPQEKLELRSYDSYPFNQKLSQFFDDKQEEMEKTGKNDYVLTSDEVEDINVNDIKNSFQPGSQEDDYKTSFKR
jgi:molecular chaperone GrpE (heat shock protein)